jgi:hypothetical protein
MLGLGSFLIAALRLGDVDHEDWTRLVARLVDSIRAPDEQRKQGKPRQEQSARSSAERKDSGVG